MIWRKRLSSSIPGLVLWYTEAVLIYLCVLAMPQVMILRVTGDVNALLGGHAGLTSSPETGTANRAHSDSDSG